MTITLMHLGRAATKLMQFIVDRQYAWDERIVGFGFG